MKSRRERNKDLEKNIKDEKKLKRKRKFKRFLLTLLIIFILFIIYARFGEPNMLITHEEKVESTTIASSFNGLKIVHFSDLHYGSTVKKHMLDKLITEINILKPDIVIFTGDLIEKDYNITKKEITLLTNKLKLIQSTYGKYSVVGNHDFYNKDFLNIMYDANFMVLNNNYDIVYNKNNDSILLYGLDDVIFGSPNLNKLKELNSISFKIILVHEPDFTTKITSNYAVDLILSGHSHNKQVNLPFIKAFWLPPEAKIYYKPYYEIDKTKLYISNGIGTSGINLRAFTPPSINFYRIVKAQ